MTDYKINNGEKGLSVREKLEKTFDKLFSYAPWKKPTPNLEPDMLGFPKSWAFRLQYLAGGGKYSTVVVDSQGIFRKQISKDIITEKGELTAASDFPALDEVKTGWTYDVSVPVTDNDPTKTNTGQSFDAGQKIYYDKTAAQWQDYTSVFTGATEKTLKGVTLEKDGVAEIFGGTKNVIEQDEELFIPENYEYNCFQFQNEGIVTLNGTLNLM